MANRSAKITDTAPDEMAETKSTEAVGVVAIGASAGGLEPFEVFFDAMPADNGLAFVIIQHLSPDFKSMMDELLARHSSMRIRRVEDGMKIEANTIYLNLPRANMSVQNGHFAMVETEPSTSLNLPINAFFKSFAKEYGDKSIGVILSGTGSDGTDGCRAIKAVNGAVFAQRPDSAKFDGMPKSVINAKLADIVASPEKLPEHILRFAYGGEFEVEAEYVPSEESPPLSLILRLIRDRIGTDFMDYKNTTVERRVRRRAEISGEPDLADYLKMLIEDKEELDALYNDLLIEVTAFFRDKEAFKKLESDIIPKVASKMAADYQIRVWIPGCASGEEAYSIAILFAEHAKKHGLPLNMKIIATDIHTRSLETASRGIYSNEALRSLSASRVTEHFEPVGGSFRVSSDLRRLVVFSPHSLLADPPFTRMDLISCRNVLIYFNDDAQQKAISMFHFALREKGVLFLGSSETVGRLKDEFDILSQRWRIYEKRRDVRLLESTLHMSGTSGSGEGASALRGRANEFDKRTRFEERKAINLALEALLEEYAPAGFLITPNGELLHVFGDAGKFLNVTRGNFSNVISDLLPDAFRLVLTAGVERFRTTQSAKFRRQVNYRDSNGERQSCVVTINAIHTELELPEHLLVVVEDLAVPSIDNESNIELPDEGHSSEFVDEMHRRIAELERDLASTEESLQTTIEELETSNEELQATNEELMASNEELQSTNEELHSVNEELFTVSAEHQKKIEELTEITSDMDHLLKSTEIGTIFLDEDFNIRRYTPAASRTFNLLPQDIGRPITHVTYKFQLGDLEQVLSNVVANGEASEREILVNESAFLLRILPYAPEPGEAEGAVIAIIDIDEVYQARKRISELADYYAGILSDITDYVIRWSKDGDVIYCNEVFASLEGTVVDKVIGHPVSKVLDHKQFSLASDDDTNSHALSYFIKNLKPNESIALQSRTTQSDGSYRQHMLKVRAIGDETGKTVAYQATGQDATDDIRYRRAMAALTSVENISELDETKRLVDLLELGCDYFGAPEAAIFSTNGKCPALEFSTDAGKEIADITPVELKSLSKAPVLASSKNASKNLIEIVNGKRGRQLVVAHPIYVEGTPFGFVVIGTNMREVDSALTDYEAGFLRLFAGWIGVGIERRNHLTRIAHSERDLQRIFDNVPVRIWYKDSNNNVLRLNKSAASSFDMSVAEAEGKSMAELDPDNAKKDLEEDLGVIKKRKPLYGKIEETSHAGTGKGWSRTDKVPFFDKDTNSWKILVASTDITELKKGEQELRAANDRLDIQQKRYEILYRNTPAMMHSIKPDGVILEVSETWLNKMGYRRSSVVGRQISDFLTQDSAFYAKSYAIPKLTEEGSVKDIEYRFVRKDGKIIEAELSAYLDRSIPDDPECLAVVVDVTERNEAREAIVQKNEELQEANEGLSKFAYVASHDLQEPLRKISQFSELLLNDYGERLDGDGPFFVDVISSSARRMSQLIKDLLALSKMSNQPLEKNEVSFETVLENVANDLEIQLQETGTVIVHKNLPSILCDQTYTEQLIRNIIANAIKYRAQSRKPKIIVSARKSKTGYRITIKDNGIGFDQDLASKMFSPFTRLHSTSEYPGSGIGLAICKTVCDRHGWKISAKGEEGVGATFTIDIS